jgi:hypothetical protein
VTKRRIDVVWDGAPDADLRQTVDRAIQKQAAKLSYLGSMRVRLFPDGRVSVVETSFSDGKDPWRDNFSEPETARIWLAAALGAERVLET